jgi:hypothetical protein
MSGDGKTLTLVWHFLRIKIKVGTNFRQQVAVAQSV